MKKLFVVLAKIIGVLLAVLLITYLVFYIKWHLESSSNMKLAGVEAPVLKVDNLEFRDLNKNGKLDTYEDFRKNIDDRIDDLIGQMSLEEKAGSMFIHIVLVGEEGGLNEIPSLSNPFSLLLETTSALLLAKNMNHFNVLLTPSAKETARWNNNMQKLAERTRLGIPITIASDPKHGKGFNFGTSVGTRFLSRWPSQLGMGATRDSALVHEFGDIARQEYLALGIRLALHPMADLATEPRWPRVNGTFGEDAELAAKLTEAYVLGFQGDSLTNHSVATMTKHFSGGGPQKEGRDSHFKSGSDKAYQGDNFAYHLYPFVEGGLKAGTAQIMPDYGIPVGQTDEDVAFAYNKAIITDLLRDSLKFEGVVCTDWGIVSDMPIKDASAWGVEHLTEKERIKKLLDAGNDMIGGESRTDLIVELVEEGKITEERIHTSLRRILRDKFILGLFDNPYVDEENLDIVGNPTFVEKGKEAQRKALVLLKNENSFLPLAKSTKVYIEGMSEDLKDSYPQIVGTIEEADVIIKKLPTPYSPPSATSNLMEMMIKAGQLDFSEEAKSEILTLFNSKPSIAVMEMDRPPVFPEINEASKAVIADFECEDEIILELIFGEFNPSGKLPIEIPSSMEAVINQKEDVPYDSKDPLYRFGHGLSYSN